MTKSGRNGEIETLDLKQGEMCEKGWGKRVKTKVEWIEKMNKNWSFWIKASEDSFLLNKIMYVGVGAV